MVGECSYIFVLYNIEVNLILLIRKPMIPITVLLKFETLCIIICSGKIIYVLAVGIDVRICIVPSM